MSQQIIEVIILKNGESRVQTKGFSGSSCREASKFLEAALGAVAAERLTDEFYAQADQRQTLREDLQ